MPVSASSAPAVSFLLGFLACALPGGLAAQDTAKPPRDSRPPNIVVLFADDAGYADFGFQAGCAKEMAGRTPHIDSIAAAGARFTNAYMSGCVCSPSRAGLLTGRYQPRFGHESNLPPGYAAGGLPLTETLMPARLRPLGYATGLIGKWHLGYPAAYHPNKRGFDRFYGLLQGSRSYFPYDKPTAHRVIQENGKPTPEVGYVTDRFGDAAVRFLAEHRDKPFFLFVSFTAPHGPLQAKAEDLAELQSIESRRRRRYAGLIKSLDDNVGKVLAALDHHGLAANTLLVFTNDNGGQTSTGAVNTPLRGRKGQLLEGGIRVPMCVRWPGRIAPGSVVEDPVISLDLLPTFVAAAGGAVPAAWKLDGVDLLPRLTGRVPRLAPRPLFWRRGGPKGEIAMRLGDLKLHIPGRGEDGRGEGQAPALYDLAKDVGEAKDCSAAHRDEVVAMQAQLAAWEAQLVTPLWGAGSKGRRRRGKD